MSSVLKKILFAFVLAFGLRACVFETFRVNGTAMLPAVYPDDVVIANKLAYGLRVPGSGALMWQWSEIDRGDLVILNGVGEPPMTLLRRVVALPGEQVVVEGAFSRMRPWNGKAKSEGADTDTTPWLEQICKPTPETAPHCEEEFGERKVFIRPIDRSESGLVDTSLFPHWKASADLRPEHYFVLADDRRDGPDSRHFGPVHVDKIVGKVDRMWIPARVLPKVEVNERVKALATERSYLKRL